MKGLVIKKPHIDNILSGAKIWEIRGSRTKVRGKIALIESGSGKIVGTAKVVDCIGPLSLVEMLKTKRKHRCSERALYSEWPFYPKVYAWVLSEAKRLKRPRPYRHPAGAVIWVNLE